MPVFFNVPAYPYCLLQAPSDVYHSYSTLRRSDWVPRRVDSLRSLQGSPRLATPSDFGVVEVPEEPYSMFSIYTFRVPNDFNFLFTLFLAPSAIKPLRSNRQIVKRPLEFARSTVQHPAISTCRSELTLSVPLSARCSVYILAGGAALCPYAHHTRSPRSRQS